MKINVVYKEKTPQNAKFRPYLERSPEICNLYHYAGNNPVRYTDTDGSTVKNNSGITLIVKPEDSKDPYIRLPNESTFDGEQDGIIFPDGTVYKTYGKSKFTNTNLKNCITCPSFSVILFMQTDWVD